MPETKSRKSRIFQAVLFALSLGMLAYFCISGNNLMVLLRSLPGLNAFWLLGAGGCVALNWALDCEIIRTLLSGAAEHRLRFWDAFRVTMVGQYFNAITPYAVAGQPMQLVALIRRGVPSGIAVSALVRKFLVYQEAISLSSLAVILVRYRFFQERVQGFMALAFVGFVYQAATMAVLLLFTFCPRIAEKLSFFVIWLLAKLHIVKKPEEAREKVRDQLGFYGKSNRAMQGNRLLRLRVFGLTLLQLTALFSVPFFIYEAYRQPGAPAFDMIAAQCFVTMISGYTPLPGAAGAAEGSFLVMFRLFFAPEVLTQAMLLWRLIAYYSCIAAGAFFVRLGKPEKQDARLENAGEPAPGNAKKNGGKVHE
jgi:glycosyltransferase 2 family protein